MIGNNRKNIGIIDHGIGNIGSIKKVLEFLDFDFTTIRSSEDYKVISSVDGFILPGVGSFDEGMKSIRDRKLDMVIQNLVDSGLPGLGICLGMQMLCTRSEEGECKEEGLKYFDAEVKLLNKRKSFVPSIGWNKTMQKRKNERDDRNIFEGDFYYLHSYSVHTNNEEEIIAQYCHGDDLITSVIQKENLVGVQFHPEKSQYSGLKLINDYFWVN